MTIELRGITKRYGSAREVVGVNGVSFVAPRRAITSLLGPSGSGKSTLLRIIAGLEVEDDGQVFVDGIELTRVPVQKRNIGFVFQNYALFGHMTVFENVAFGLETRDVPAKLVAERVSALLELIQLEGYAERMPHELSGGQRQRVALARALAPEPRVLLLDEPFGALDTRVRLELREWLHRMHEKTHVTTLLVTHDQEEALELSEHVVLLSEGHVEQAGAPEELYHRPVNRFVASFLGGAKVLRGAVHKGRAEFVERTFSAPAKAPEGALVEAFVRPQNVTLTKAKDSTATTDTADRTVAHIDRLVAVGSSVKVHLRLPDGDSLTVPMTLRELNAKGLVAGDPVVLDFGDVIVTPPLDYVI
jgi:sulfate transport system ATP-binding protein